MVTREINVDKITEIVFSDIDISVYDLEVEDNHNYCITEDNIVVHNSGKSYFAGEKVLIRCLQNEERILVCRKVASSIKNSVFKLFQDLISDFGLTNHITTNKTDLSFNFDNGSQIITTGLDDVEKLKSIQGITSIWVEEATEVDYQDFAQLDLRLRGQSESYKQIILTFNPIDETHWIKEYFFDNKDEDIDILHTTYKDNQFIDEEYKKTLEKKVGYDENLYRIYVKGMWGRIRTGAEFYNQFKYTTHVRELTYNPEDALHISFDFNVVPYISLLVSQIVKIGDTYEVRILDEFCLKNPKNKTDILCREFLRFYPKISTLYYYGDSTGRNKDTAAKYHNYQIIEQELRHKIHNSSCRVPFKNPPVIARRNFINNILTGKHNINIVVDPSCKNMIADFESVVEDADGKKLKKKVKDKQTGQSYEQYGHMSDCSDYLLCEAFKAVFKQYN